MAKKIKTPVITLSCDHPEGQCCRHCIPSAADRNAFTTQRNRNLSHKLERAADIDEVARQMRINAAAAEQPIARGAQEAAKDNVRDYFTNALGRPADDNRFDELDDLPVKSECGHACALAIDAARLLMRHVEYSAGKNSLECENLCELTKHVCFIYYFG